ncbi:hypothetical protein K3495_g13740 [Podosphaera aphanis]|nr:hypothetical protein K3495_g13740 [Podosphaera aphanis]
MINYAPPLDVAAKVSETLPEIKRDIKGKNLSIFWPKASVPRTDLQPPDPDMKQQSIKPSPKVLTEQCTTRQTKNQTQQPFLSANQQPVFTQEQFQSFVSTFMPSLETRMPSSQEKTQEKEEKVQTTQPPVLLESQQPVFPQEKFQLLVSTFMSWLNKQMPSSQEKSRENEGKFRAADLGFLDPNNNATHPVEYIDGKTIYHNVFSFIHRIKVNTTGIMSGLLGRLKCGGKAASLLARKSRKLSSGAKSSKHNSTIAKHRAPTIRASEDVIIAPKGAGTGQTEYGQILTAHQHLAPELKVLVPRPTQGTSLTTFIQNLTMAKSDWFDLYQPYQNSRNRDYFYETKRYDSTVAAKTTGNATGGRNFTDGPSSNSYRNSSHGVPETSRNKPLDYTKNVSGKYAHKFTRNEKAAKARAYNADLPDNGNDPYETYFEGADETRSEGRCKSDSGSTTDETEDENNQVSALIADLLKVYFLKEN